MLNLKKQLVRKNKYNYKNISELLNYFFNKIKIKKYLNKTKWHQRKRRSR